MSRKRIVIAGAGAVGSAAGLILREYGEGAYDLLLGDQNEELVRTQVKRLLEDSTRDGRVEAFDLPPDGESEQLNAVLSTADILLDCLPGSEAPRMARLARKHDLHYANLTEHVKETREVMRIADGAKRGFLLQTGLAPGFINVLAMSLYRRFSQQFGSESVRSIRMRVGALPQTAQAPHFYGLNWSPIGVAVEYIEPAVVIRDYQVTTRPSLTERAPLIIGGVHYEEGLTSGGAADLPQAFAGKIKNLDYKSLRYPGHFDWVEGVLAGLRDDASRAERLAEALLNTVPMQNEDVVVVFCGVQGLVEGLGVRSIEASMVIRPIEVGRRHLRAIQTTTAAGLAQAAHFLLSGDHTGVVLQSQIDPDAFIAGPFVSRIYR